MKKLESMKQPMFEALPKTALQNVLGGGDWCEEPTGAGGRPDGQANWSSDTILRDGNGVRVGFRAVMI